MKPADLLCQYKLVHHCRVISEGSKAAMVRLSARLPGSFVAAVERDMSGKIWKLAAVPETFDAKTLLTSGHNSTL